MAIKIIPITPALLNYGFRIDLDGTTYTLIIKFNSREGRWFLHVGDSAGTLIVTSTKVVLNVDLLDIYQQPGLPPGSLFILNSDSDSEIEPGQNDLGINTLLLYDEAN